MIALAAITLSLQIARTTLDALDGVSIEVAAHNSSRHPVDVSFPQPSEYEIDILKGSRVIFSTLRPLPSNVKFPPHTRALQPGPSVLVVYIWNTIESDGTTPAAGTYTVRARLLGARVTPAATTTIRFAAPTPIIALPKLKPSDEVTIAGRLDLTKQHITDSTGTIALGRKLATAPNAPIAVRGYLTKNPTDGSPMFFVERWAPLEPIPSAPPVPTTAPSATPH